MSVSKLISYSKRPANLLDNYRAKRSEIDESLFGPKKVFRRTAEETLKMVANVRKGELKNPQLGILSNQQLDRMRRRVGEREKSKLMASQLLNGQLQREKQMATQKRTEMLRLSQSCGLRGTKSETNLLEQVSSRKGELTSQQKQQVKEMNELIEEAKTATVRERQLQLKKSNFQLFKQQQKKKDLIMQIERLKQIKMLEEADLRKKEELRREREYIIEQIKERQIDRLKAKEEQEREAHQLIKSIEVMNQQQQRKLQLRKQQQKVINSEILDANSKAILIKQKRLIEEQEEDAKILQYNLAKDQLEQQTLAEHRRIKEEKQREVQRLRQKQQKANDRQAQLDAMRAKRDYQQSQRQKRARQKREAQTRARLAEQLAAIRQQQQIYKLKKLQAQCKAEQEEHMMSMEKIRLKDLEQQQLQQRREQKIKKHNQQLKRQIHQQEERKKAEQRQRKVEEIKILQNRGSSSLLEDIKKQKLLEMKRLGIPEKFWKELQNYRLIK